MKRVILLGVLFCSLLPGLAFGELENKCNTLADERPVPSPRDIFIRALGERFGTPVDLKDLTITNIDQALGWPKMPAPNLQVFYKGNRLANCDTNKNDEVMFFDIDVDTEFRGLKVYAYVLGELLQRHPEIRSLPSRMRYTNSHSAVAFFDSVLGSRDKAKAGLQTASLEAAPAAERMIIRAKIIREFGLMPSSKVRRRLGFENIVRIIIDAERETISFDVQKGKQEIGRERVILIRHGQGTEVQGFELLANGELIETDGSALLLPKYDAMKKIDNYYK